MEKQRSEGWFEQRIGKVTGSNVGAALGLNPYKSPEDLIRQMVREYHGCEREFVSNQATLWGTFHEDGAIAEFTMEHGLKVEPCGFFVHPEHDWLGASPDGLVGVDAVMECKCPYGLRKAEAPQFKSAEEQKHYWAQMQIEMICTGRKKTYFWQWAPRGTRLEIVHIDRPWLDENIPKLKAFHELYLSERSNLEHLEERRMKLDGKKYQELLDQYDQAVADAKAAAERQKDVLARLELATEGNDALVCGRKFSRVVRAGSVSYAKVVKEHLPDLDLEPYRGQPSSYWNLT